MTAAYLRTAAALVVAIGGMHADGSARRDGRYLTDAHAPPPYDLVYVFIVKVAEPPGDMTPKQTAETLMGAIRLKLGKRKVLLQYRPGEPEATACPPITTARECDVVVLDQHLAPNNDRRIHLKLTAMSRHPHGAVEEFSEPQPPYECRNDDGVNYGIWKRCRTQWAEDMVNILVRHIDAHLQRPTGNPR
jgi:hypothetical protein